MTPDPRSLLHQKTSRRWKVALFGWWLIGNRYTRPLGFRLFDWGRK